MFKKIIFKRIFFILITILALIESIINHDNGFNISNVIISSLLIFIFLYKLLFIKTSDVELSVYIRNMRGKELTFAAISFFLVVSWFASQLYNLFS